LIQEGYTASPIFINVVSHPIFQEKHLRPLPPQPPEEPALTTGMTVVAEYEYTPSTPQDLELRKDEEYIILEMSDSNWWRARDKYG
jgi:Bruton agammaglobulinemia tyrosine kinase